MTDRVPDLRIGTGKVGIAPLVDLWRSQAVVLMRNGWTYRELRAVLGEANAKAKDGHA
jgi:hypothetical protein